MTSHSTFEEIGLDPAILQYLHQQGLTTPMPVQSKVIAPLRDGRDVIVQSPTGSGKTLAYLLPILQKMIEQPPYHALVLAPTRELVMQITRVAESLFAAVPESLGLRAVALPGGADVKRQIDKLKGTPALIVGTPGRVTDLMEKRKVKAHLLKLIVIDEADQMITLGFWDNVQTIIKSTLRDRQLALFSATMPASVEKKVASVVKEPVRVTAGFTPDALAGETSANIPERSAALGLAPGISHWYLKVDPAEKLPTLRRLLDTQKMTGAIVFVSDTDDVRLIARELTHQGVTAEGLQGEMSTLMRTNIMRDFREGRLKILVTSDVLARGLDVPRISHVIHYTPAFDADHYTHRAGRTARGGGKGLSITLVTSKDRFVIDKLEKQLGISFQSKVLYDGKLKDVRPGKGKIEHTKQQ